jgi:DNA-binding GntR family transcriptional regulator
MTGKQTLCTTDTPAPPARGRGAGKPPTALRTAQQHAVDSLRGLLVAGELRPGERVNQEDVAERIGLSLAPVREALRVLEQEGQVTYAPRRGYFVTELRMSDLREIYELRRLLEARAARQALPELDDEALERVEQAARDCVAAAHTGDVGAELAANRRFHFATLDATTQPHALRLIRLLWDSTEAYRAMYYNLADERRRSVEAHDRIVAALRARDAERLVAELDDHRDRALHVLADLLGEGDEHGEGERVGR